MTSPQHLTQHTRKNTMATVEKLKEEVPVLKCPKNMKLPKAVKAMAALSGKSKEDQRFLMRSIGIALHEQTGKSKANPNSDRKSLIPSSGPKA